MQINLRKAHKLVTKITERIGELEFESNTVTFSAFQTNITDGEILKQLDEGYATTENRFTEISNLMKTRAGVRRMIQQRNETSGINDLITRRKAIKDFQQFLGELYQGGRTQEQPTAEIIRGKMEAAKAAAANTSSYIGDSQTRIIVTSISPDFTNKLKDETRKTQDSLEEIEESLMELNSTSKIQIDDEFFLTLRKHSIIS